MKHSNPGKPVPPQYKHVINLEWHRRFPWRERLLIFIGGSLVVKSRILTVNSPGQFHGDFSGTVTPLRTAAAHIVETVKEQREKDAGIS